MGWWQWKITCIIYFPRIDQMLSNNSFRVTITRTHNFEKCQNTWHTIDYITIDYDIILSRLRISLIILLYIWHVSWLLSMEKKELVSVGVHGTRLEVKTEIAIVWVRNMRLKMVNFKRSLYNHQAQPVTWCSRVSSSIELQFEQNYCNKRNMISVGMEMIKLKPILMNGHEISLYI